jgi:hypothetical protein
MINVYKTLLLMLLSILCFRGVEVLEFSLAIEPFIVDNHGEEEKEEQVEPPTTPNLTNNKEMSTEAHSFITIPLETFHESQASFIQCLKEPFYAKTLKDLCKEVGKPRNHRPKKILLSNKVGYLRWRNILLEGYQILKKKGWKGLVGHPNDRGKCGIFYFLFFALYFRVFFCSFCHFISCQFIFFV